MAHRNHVAAHVARFVAALAAVLAVAACSDAGPQPLEHRGRVIDQDTGLPIAGAIVVGKYMGSRGFEGASSCNRVESAVSDNDGWFTLPLDSRDSPPFMEAYHRGYKWGRGPRKAWRGLDGNMNHWQVAVNQWDAENRTSQVVRVEPTIYHSKAEALEASREWKDVYLKPFTGSREERLDELHRLTNAGSCVAPHQTTAGPIPFFEAIYNEEAELGDVRACSR